ncbi:MAG TPA: hypothetical protein VGF12_09510 [Roseateles sp.]|uniref:hypothetical protein n=1 Tax=Roseateles sp. TaxID=1971397 RepID=UPI002ED8BDEF
MRLKLDDLVAVKGAGLLPAFAWALVAAFAIGAVVSGVLVWWLKEGQAAIEENAQLRADTKAWADIAKGQREQHVQQTVEFGAAIKRLGAIAQEREDEREAQRQWMAAQSAALDELRRLRPDLDRIHLGLEFVRHWNKANTGAVDAVTPATRDPGQPPAAVPGAAAPAEQRSEPVHGPGAARPGGGAVSRLQEQQGAADPRYGRVAGHGLALVLPSGEGRRNQGQGMPE